ncbi:ATP synthase gamma chain [bacterium BMS3Abin03]|nr:ATP synthase gamma chain [bacterium BMS3Abin03]HDZ58615.1 ATP synthase F1 subunit gamma [Ignavibacteriales bacterium]
MATLRDIKRRIVGVKNTQQITKAMKMVAAAKLRRAQNNVINARPYSDEIATLLSRLATGEDIPSNPFFEQREIRNVALVVITSDRGLCGAFNHNIIKEADRYIEEELKAEDIFYQVYCVGKKASDYFGTRDYPVFKSDVGLFTGLNYSSALEISNSVIPKFLDGTFDKVQFIYNSFVSIIQQKITLKQLLPIPFEKTDEEANDSNYIFEPDQKYIFEYLVPKHLKAQVWRALLESNAAELSARMTAMDNATTNAEELIKSLKLTYNKERQAAITKEILEIVSGANALKTST